MRKALTALIATTAFVAAALWFISAPETLPESVIFSDDGNIDNGRMVFYAGGCSSCHSAPKSEGDTKLLLTGGRAFASAFGTFYAPNISSDPEYGIGTWSSLELANAMINGVSPSGKHYYPAFPYTSYSRAKPEDIVDLRAYLNTLPASQNVNIAHDLPLPFRFRRALGLWKALYLTDTPAIDVSSDLARGRHLVEGLGHCTECHTPRTMFGGLRADRWLAGAPLPEGNGRVPNITHHKDGLAWWSIDDLAEYLSSGFTPDFDSASGVMVDVIANTSQLTDSDRYAIAAYLKAIPAIAKP